jgi:energy-coupling factor transport system substrate-specific component
MTGALTAFASNMILGQGPWTLWQMFAWGMMGFLSGVLSAQLKKYMIFRIVYGFLWGFIFGWVMNLWYVTGGYLGDFSVKALILAGIASSFMDMTHGLVNGFLLFFNTDRYIKIFSRIAIKYGLTTVKENKI